MFGVLMLLLTFATEALCQREVRLTSDVSYSTVSPSCVLDIAEPIGFGSEGLRPAIVIIHGGGWSAGSKHDPVYRDLLIDYALQGYVTISVNYRLVQEAPFPACIQDVKCAIRWLKAHAQELRVDPERIGCTGHSAGGHLSLMVAVSTENEALEGDGPWHEYSSSVSCAVGGAPPTEIQGVKDTEYWPIGYIRGGQPPILILQGSEDPIVRPNLTDDYVEKMRKAGSNVDYIRIPGAHDVAFNAGLEITKPAMDAFFARHLQNKHAAQPLLKVKAPEGGGKGPYRAVAVSERSLPEFVVYRPADMRMAAWREKKLPVMVYANGGCMDTSVHVEKMLIEIASHGYVIIAIGEMQNYPHDRREKSTPASMLTDAMDWIDAQAVDSTSAYYNVVDVERIAACGHSCGGAQVLAIADDPRVKSYMILNAGMGEMEMAGASRKSLKNLHAPIIYMIGGKGDIAHGNAVQDYKAIKRVPVYFADMTEAGHSATFAQPYGGAFAQMAIRWMDWQLKGREQHAPIFQKGKLDDFPGWTMEGKNF